MKSCCFRRLVLALILVIIGIGQQVLEKAEYNLLGGKKGVLGVSLINIAKGRIGPGCPTTAGNHLSFEGIQPGDIILGGNQGATYGEFSHCAIYEGQGMAWEAWLSTGIRKIEVTKFREYDRALIVRVQTTEKKRLQALEYVRRQQGKLFFPLAFKPGERFWNCTKIIWKAYLNQGIDLDAGQDLWVTPDNMLKSGKVKVVSASTD